MHMYFQGRVIVSVFVLSNGQAFTPGGQPPAMAINQLASLLKRYCISIHGYLPGWQDPSEKFMSYS